MNLRSLSLACLLSTLPLTCQDPAEPSGTAVSQLPPTASKSVRPPVVVTLAFQGGTLAELVAAIRKVEAKANIFVASAAADAKVPPLDLRGAGLEQALEGACAVATSPMLIRMRDFRGAGEPVFTITAQEPPTQMTNGRPNGPAATAAGPRKETTEVYSLNRLLDPKDGSGFSVTTVLSAIEAAVGVDGQLAALKFHKESGLLILRGSAEQVNLVRDVLTSLERDVVDRRKQDNARKGIPNEPTKEQPK